MNSRAGFLFILSVIFGIFTFLFANQPHPNYVGYTKLGWAELKGFTTAPGGETLPSQANYGLGVISWDKAGASGSKRRAESEFFLVRSQLLEIETAGVLALAERLKPTLALVGENEEVYADFELPTAGSSIVGADWSPQRFLVSESAVGKKAKFIFRTPPNPQPGAWFAIRDRIDFYKALRLPEFGNSFYLSALLFGLSLVGFVLIFQPRVASQKQIFRILFCLAALVQFRNSPFFYWDEWHVLERFKNFGLSGVIYTHNEHFLPAFFSWFFLEAKLFGDRYLAYLLLSLLLHALNGTLLFTLLKRLGATFRYSVEAAWILSVLFVCSSLHAETLQWAFEQSILLSQCCSLAAMLLTLDFWGRLSMWRGVVIALLSVISPLTFGNGFILPGAILLVLFAANPPGSSLTPWAWIKRALPLVFLSATGAALGLFLYHSHKSSTGHGIDQARPFGHLQEIAEYLWVGAEYGAVLRAFALFPALGPESTLRALAWLGIHSESPFLLLAHLGFLVSLLMLGFAYRERETRLTSLRLWILGQAFIFLTLILPALGRWQLGVGQSLSLRYHYASLIAVSWMALPFIALLIERAKLAALPRYFGILCLSLCLTAHIFVGAHFDYFTRQGYEHRMFVDQLRAWEQELAALRGQYPNTDYEASGTPLAGMHPANRATITPGRHPNDILAVLDWLQGAK